jgi:hypothetical protein
MKSTALARTKVPVTALVGAVIAIVAIVIAAVYFLILSRSPRGVPIVTVGGSSFTGTKQADEGRTHVPDGSPINYVNNPPSSGNHYPAPLPWGRAPKGAADRLLGP